MYLKHFDLDVKPFNLVPDPNWLYMSGQHKSAVATLEYGLQEVQGVILLTGDAGVGKTALIGHILQRLDADNVNVGVLNNTVNIQCGLLPWVASAYGLSVEGKSLVDLHAEFSAFLYHQHQSDKHCVLVIDEAQSLSQESLEELRLLSNSGFVGNRVLKLMLVASTELKQRLMLPAFGGFAQRVSAEYHLPPLGLGDTSEYIDFRMQRAGGRPETFDELSRASVFFLSGGVPRLINTLCDYGLVHAYAAKQDVVNADIIADVVSGRDVGGINRTPLESADRVAAREFILEAAHFDIQEILS